ncbi:hypothetical protein ACHQM5_003731 [Ranunculus cassubicifolius]
METDPKSSPQEENSTTIIESDPNPNPSLNPKPESESDTVFPDDFVHIQDQDDLTSSAMKTDDEQQQGENSNSQENFIEKVVIDDEQGENSSSKNLENFVERVVGDNDRIVNEGVEDSRLENMIENEGVEGESMMEEEENQVSPEEIMKNVVLLECESSVGSGVCEVYLVGTAHVSQESCREVQAVISYLKPQVVFLELCSSRVAILTPQNLQVPTMSEMIHMWKKRNMNAFGVLYSWFLAKVASKLEVFPGSEFRVAYEEAMKYGGKVVLGDRPVQITLRRTWGKMKLWHKVKFLYSMFFQAMFLPSPEALNKMLKEMDDVDMLTLVVQEMSKAFPTLMETLLYERDLYMSSTLLKVAREHSSVVAVVGKGHLQGIKKNWQQPVQIKELLKLPERNSVSVGKILTRFGVAVAGVAIVSGIYFGGKR